MKTEAKQPEPIKLYSTEQACKEWGISKWFLYDLVKQGKISPITNAGKGWKFKITDLKGQHLERL